MPDTSYTVPSNVNSQVDAMLGAAPQTPGTEVKASDALYKVVGDTKIPVSKARGKLWKSRLDAAKKRKEDFSKAGMKCTKYYRHDQAAFNEKHATNSKSTDAKITSTENIIYSNSKTLLPIVYSRDPKIEITDIREDEDDNRNDETQASTQAAERLINRVLTLKNSPGVNLKPKARKAILGCLLNNEMWAIIGYVQKENSSEAALTEIRKLAESLEKADDQKEIREIEGQLQALETKINALSPGGFTLKIKSMDEVFIDPNSKEDDFSDADFAMYSEFISTDFLNAQYATKSGENGDYKSIYEPTHVLDTISSSGAVADVDEQVRNFTLLKKDANYTQYGYDNEEGYKDACRTKCWFVWDKTTRRLELYADNYWTWPMWVWDDPYGLQEFFPCYKLQFNIDPFTPFAKSEVAYYIDQQDEINEINSEMRRIRKQGANNFLYNKNIITDDDVTAVLKGADGTARGIKLPDGVKINDAIFTFTPPSANLINFFNKDTIYKSVDRISSATEQLRGGQFKTNTTNKQVDFVRDATSIQVEDKSDIIEDWIGCIGQGFLQLAVKFVDDNDVAKLLGEEDAKEWVAFKQSAASSMMYSLEVVGGSMQKPTSAAKQQMAMQLTQILGQFAKASPVTVVVMLKLLEKSFNEIVISDDDWQKIIQSIEQQIQQPQPTAPGAPPAAPPPEGAAPTQPQLTPEQEQAIQIAVQKGVPPEVAIKEVLAQSAATQQPTTQ